MNVALRHGVMNWVFYSLLATGIVAALSYGGYSYYLLKNSHDILETSNADLQYGILELSDKLKASEDLNGYLTKLILEVQQENEEFGEQVEGLSSTVRTLDKLAHTDKELLEKYSSVYFLNENYVPKNLRPINATYVYNTKEQEQVIDAVLPHLVDLLQEAASDRVSLRVLSGYRSYGEQSALKSTYKVTYGAGSANSFSADQGYSEHQLGTAVDFTTPSVGAPLSGFDKTPEYIWLTTHAHLYGFSLSYPKGNTHFVFEPWHWRFVGISLAKRLHNENKTLYDLDQRDIDTYLAGFLD